MTPEDFEKMKARAEAAGKRLRTDEDFRAGCEYWRNRPNLAEWLNMKAEATKDAVIKAQENDVAPLVDAAVHLLTYPEPPLPTLPPGTRHKPGIPVIEDIVY